MAMTLDICEDCELYGHVSPTLTPVGKTYLLCSPCRDDVDRAPVLPVPTPIEALQEEVVELRRLIVQLQETVVKLQDKAS